MSVEYELKYKSDGAVLQALCKEFPAHHTHFQMQTTYYDTPSRTLSARHYTLRLRQENLKTVCTLKSPAKGYGRQELEIECKTIEEGVKVLCKLDCPTDFPSLVAEGVTEVCGAKFHRIAIPVITDRFQAELALDEGMLFHKDRTIPLCEVELEYKGGDCEEMTAYARILATLYGLEPEEKSKFARALQLGE